MNKSNAVSGTHHLCVFILQRTTQLHHPYNTRIRVYEERVELLGRGGGGASEIVSHPSSVVVVGFSNRVYIYYQNRQKSYEYNNRKRNITKVQLSCFY